MRALVRPHLLALALEAVPAPAATAAHHLALLALHLGGLLLVARLAHWPLWAAPVILLAFTLLHIFRCRWWPEALAPLVLVYSVALLRLVCVWGLGQVAPAWLDYGWALALSAAWGVLILLRGFERLALAWLIAAAAAAVVFAWQLWRLAPAGVTGADPFAYVQMALDLAQHGTPRHHFPLAPFAAGLGLPTLPVAHVGYVLPDAAGWAPTVWPAGYSALLALVFRLAGEHALLTFNLWVALASFAATAVLAAALAGPGSRAHALAVAGGAVFILATSPEQWVRLVVPLADGAAQFFTAAAVALALVASKQGGWPDDRRWIRSDTARVAGRNLIVAGGLGALAGLALGAAFVVRYTQALVAPALVLAALWAFKDPRRRAFAAGFAAAGALVVVPDLLYRTQLFGAPWRFGTGELALFDWRAVPGAARQLAGELLRPEEYGWLWVLTLAGALHAWRRQRRGVLLAAAAYGPVLAFHLLYPFVRARDVLFVLPPLAACAALGGAALLPALWRRGSLARAAFILALLVLSALRLQPLLTRSPGFFTFGGLLPEQRLALESLATLTEPEAVIACSLNSGAVELYSRRRAVRPGGVLQPEAAWSSDQWLTFVAALLAEGRPVYVLMDSSELDAPLAALQSRYTLTRAADLFVPVYVRTGGSENLTVPLWRVVRPATDASAAPPFRNSAFAFTMHP